MAILARLKRETGAYNLSAGATVLSCTPDAHQARQCQAVVLLGSESKPLSGTGGEFDLTLTLDGRPWDGGAVRRTLGTATQAAVLSTEFTAPAAATVELAVTSPNAADTDVTVTVYLIDTGGLSLVVGGNDANTVLLLHCDGEHDSATFLDSAVGGTAKTITPIDTARQVSSSSARYGHACLRCDGGGAHLQLPGCGDFAFVRGDFTVEAWAYIRDPLRSYPFGWYNDADNFLRLEPLNVQGDAVRFGVRYRAGGVDVLTAQGTTHVAVADTWCHFAIVRYGRSLSLYVGGGVHASYAQPAAEEIALVDPHNWTLYLGSDGEHTLDGDLDEIRVSTVARHTEEFNPYANPYTPEMSRSGRGSHRLYAAATREGRGIAGVILHPYTRAGRGTGRVYRSTQRDGRGSHRLYAAATREGRGVAGVVLHPYTRSGRGLHRVYGPTQREGRGEHAILSGPYAKEGRGLHRVYGPTQREGRGLSTLLRQYSRTGRGRHRIEDDALALYELFHALGAEPNLDGAPTTTFAALPRDHAIAGAGIHYLVVRRRNQYGLVSRNVICTQIELDAAGAEIMRAPSDGFGASVAPAVARRVRVRAYYFERVDADRSADQWLIYLTDTGVDPDPDVDTPTVIGMAKADGVAKLDWQSGQFTEGATIKVLVRTRRSLANARDSVSVGVLSTTATGTGPSGGDLQAGYEQGGTPIKVG